MATKLILGCNVVADGKDYPAGTELEKLPKRCRESARRWCRTAGNPSPPAAGNSGGSSDDAKGNDEPANETNPPEPEKDSQDGETNPGKDDANEPAAETVVRTDLDRPIAELELSDDIKDLLSAEGILTIGNALEYLTTNKSFRIIKGIGKVSNQQILDQIEPDKADAAEPPTE